jgi:hypothetical protein
MSQSDGKITSLFGRVPDGAEVIELTADVSREKNDAGAGVVEIKLVKKNSREIERMKRNGWIDRG